MAHPAQGASALDIQSEILVVVPLVGLTQLHGTRAMLEAEGVIPAGMKWPEGLECHAWDDAQGNYSINRTRPKGVKGPRSQMAQIDWWCYRWRPRGALSHFELALRAKQREMDAIVQSATPQRVAALSRGILAHDAARKDARFQAWITALTGRRGRKAGAQTSSTQSENNHAA